MNDSNSHGTVDYDAHFDTKIEFSINQVIKSMSILEMNTLHHIC